MRTRLLSLLFVLTTVASAAATPAVKSAPAAAKSPASGSKDAPADEYFGAFGMSPLSIRSTIGFLGRQYHYRTISDHDLLRKALQTEAALRVWRSRYPQDSWLAPTFFHLEQLYQAVQSAEARKHATAILKDVVRYYPDTKEGHLSRARLAAGFPPLVPESPLLVTPAPTAAPAAGGSPSPGETAAPAPSATESPVPAGSASPAAGGTATPAAGGTASPATSASSTPPSAVPSATASPK